MSEQILTEYQSGFLAGLRAAAQMIDNGDGRPVTLSKSDKCPHEKFRWEDCEDCCADAIREMANSFEALPVAFGGQP
jgi:hypothetical protein